MTIGWPEGIFLTLIALNVLTNAINDREAKTGLSAVYHFPCSVVAAMISLGLLYWGGFFA